MNSFILCKLDGEKRRLVAEKKQAITIVKIKSGNYRYRYFQITYYHEHSMSKCLGTNAKQYLSLANVFSIDNKRFFSWNNAFIIFPESPFFNTFRNFFGRTLFIEIVFVHWSCFSCSFDIDQKSSNEISSSDTALTFFSNDWKCKMLADLYNEIQSFRLIAAIHTF